MEEHDSLYQAQLQLAEAYFERVRGYFPKLGHGQRVSLLGALDKLVDIHSPDRQANQLTQFDYNAARKVREEDLKLTRKEAISKIGAKMHEITLFKYETGRLVPSSEKEPGRSYLSWLEKVKKQRK